MNKKRFITFAFIALDPLAGRAEPPSNLLCDICAEYANCLQSECQIYADEDEPYYSDTIEDVATYCREEVHYYLDDFGPFNKTMIDDYLLTTELSYLLVYDIMGGMYTYKYEYDDVDGRNRYHYGDIFDACTNTNTNVCACPSGYYLAYSYKNNRVVDCVPCPSGGNNPSGTLKEKCFMPTGSSFSDKTGGGVYTNTCFYQQY